MVSISKKLAKEVRMASDTREASYFHLLQPELLEECALRQILELRCIKLQNLDSMKKEKLVEIFHRVAVPLPQRKYKDNRRGKLLTRMRRKQENSRQRVQPEEKSNTVTYGFSSSSSTLSSSRTSLPQNRDRLKPPPDAINFERKTIKLNSSSSKSSDLDNISIKRMKKPDSSSSNGDILDKIIIKDRRKEREKEEKVKNVDSAGSHKEESKKAADESNSSSSDKKEVVARKIKLKRSHSTISSEVSSSTSQRSSEDEAKKQKSKICWP